MNKTLRVQGAEAWAVRACLASEGVTAKVRPVPTRSLFSRVDVVVPEEGVAAARVALDLYGFACEEVGDERG